MFITIEDETGVANLVVWPSLFERRRRIVLSSGMLALRGKIQRDGAVVNLVAHHLADLSAELASVGDRDGGFPLPHGRGDQIRDGAASRRISGTCRRARSGRGTSTFRTCTSIASR
ncbi:DNA polymerase III alpha subunit [Bradyrhizobium sp. GM6.1]